MIGTLILALVGLVVAVFATIVGIACAMVLAQQQPMIGLALSALIFLAVIGVVPAGIGI